MGVSGNNVNEVSGLLVKRLQYPAKQPLLHMHAEGADVIRYPKKNKAANNATDLHSTLH